MSVRVFPLALAALLAALPAASRGDLILTATGGDLSPGGSTLVVPVAIATNSADSLGQFTLVFDIVPSASNPIAPVASLAFIGPASYSTDPTLNDTSYLYNASNPDPDLAGTASFKYDTNQVFGVASDPGSIGFNTHFAGADAYDGNDPSGAVSLTGAGYLIANLVVTFPAATTTNPSGDLFDIVLDVAHSSFQDGFGASLTLSQSTVSNPTLATVHVGTQAVPEPSAFALALMGFASAGIRATFRGRTGARRPTGTTRPGS